MHGGHDVCVSGVFEHMCVYVFLCMSVRCVLIDPNRLRRHSLHVLHSQKCSDFNDYKQCLCFENYYFEWQVFLFEWISISHENSAVMYVNLYYGWWCHQGETQLHAVVGLCLLAVMFIQYLFHLIFCSNTSWVVDFNKHAFGLISSASSLVLSVWSKIRKCSCGYHFIHALFKKHPADLLCPVKIWIYLINWVYFFVFHLIDAFIQLEIDDHKHKRVQEDQAYT